MSYSNARSSLKAQLRQSLTRVIAEDAKSAVRPCNCGCSAPHERSSYVGASNGEVLRGYYARQSENLRIAADALDGRISSRALRESHGLKEINHLLCRSHAPRGASLMGLLSDTDALKLRLAELSINPYVDSRVAVSLRREIGQILQEVREESLQRHLRDVHHVLGEYSCNQGDYGSTGQAQGISTYRPGTPEFFSNAKMLRSLMSMGQYAPSNDWESELLSTDLGEWASFAGEMVPLDFPIIEIAGEWDEPCDTCSGRVIEAKYKGKEVELGKPKRGGGKAYVYVRDPKTGNVKKVSFGSSMPDAMGDSDAARKRRKSFGNRHNCAKKKDRTHAGYWACRATKFFGRNIPGWW